MYVYIYIYMYVCIYICMYICVSMQYTLSTFHLSLKDLVNTSLSMSHFKIFQNYVIVYYIILTTKAIEKLS